MIVVDTSVWINQMRDRRTAAVELLRELDESTLQIGDVILLELLQGASDEAGARRILRNMQRFDVASMLNGDVAIAAAANYRKLRGLGITIRKSLDLVIGTHCLLGGHTLLHDDRDFRAMSIHLGLEVLP